MTRTLTSIIPAINSAFGSAEMWEPDNWLDLTMVIIEFPSEVDPLQFGTILASLANLASESPRRFVTPMATFQEHVLEPAMLFFRKDRFLRDITKVNGRSILAFLGSLDPGQFAVFVDWQCLAFEEATGPLRDKFEKTEIQRMRAITDWLTSQATGNH